MAKPLVIFGTGSFAECAAYLFEHDGGRTVAAFAVSAERREQDEQLGKPVLDWESLMDTHPPQEYDVFVAIGYSGLNRSRAGLVAESKDRGYGLATYVSPRATTFPNLTIGENCFVFEDNTIQPFAKIGDDVVLWSGNHVGHHSMIGDHCFITSHVVISGHVTVGAYSFVGVNASIRDGITIGENCIIGADALIMKSTGDREVYIARRTEADERTSDQLRF